MAIAVQSIVRAGLQASYTVLATAHNDSFTNDGKRTFIHVVNGATATTLTVVTPATVDGLAVADRTVSIGSNEEHFVGPFPKDSYGSSVTIQFSDTSDGTVAALKVPAE
jgi:hypothetical protein